MTDAQLIEDYLARGGKITKCPPRTFSVDAATMLSWKEQRALYYKAIAYRSKAARAKNNRTKFGHITDNMVRIAVITKGIRASAAEWGMSERQLSRRAKALGVKPAGRWRSTGNRGEDLA